MERKRINSGALRSVGYDPARNLLEVELATGEIVEYAAVGREIARRLMESQSAWSYYRDNIEDEFTARRAGRSVADRGGDNPFG